MRMPWTKSEVHYLLKHYPDQLTKDVAQHLNRDVKSVYQKANALGIKKSRQFLSSAQSGRIQSGAIGISGRFKKGMTPWNKGIYYKAGGNSAKTRFKKGQLPHNTLSDGVITLRTDSKTGRQYYYKRLAKAKWREVHVLNWESKHGKMPKGKILRFIDGNSLNPIIENLMLIDRVDNMKLNTIHRYPPALKKTIRTLGKLKRKIKKYEKQN